ncbi:hypothetical protein LguiA_015295 [Lonicera macranthoides]
MGRWSPMVNSILPMFGESLGGNALQARFSSIMRIKLRASKSFRNKTIRNKPLEEHLGILIHTLIFWEI